MSVSVREIVAERCEGCEVLFVRVRLLREKKGRGLLSVVEWGPRV